MDTVQTLLLVGLLILQALFWRALKQSAFSYAAEKGKNLATKQDIEEITKKIEAVRGQYASLVHVHRAQVELELRVYEELWDALDVLRRKTLALRPPFDTADAKEAEEQQRRGAEFADAYNKLTRTVHGKRPFYPEDVHQKVTDVIALHHTEALAHQLDTKFERETDWNVALENREKIHAAINELCEAIRDRIASLSTVV